MSAPAYPYNQTLEFFGAGPDSFNGLDSRFITDDEHKTLQKLRSQLIAHARGNEKKQLRYEARQVIEHLEISVPAHLHDIGVAVGWGGTVIDALDERIDWLGWVTASGDLRGLDDVYADNDLAVESGYPQLDGLITGMGFVSVGAHPDDENRVLVTPESSSNATVIWDYRKRRSIAGLSQTRNDANQIIMETLYLEDVNIVIQSDPLSGEMSIINRDQHDAGRCFLTRMPNKSRPYQPDGRSELTAAVRYYTDAAVRTMLGMEVNREFYTAPQRIILNAKPEDFGATAGMTPEEKFRLGLRVTMGFMNIVPPREDNEIGDPPSVYEFKPAPPTPYIEQVKAYSIQMSAETGLPATLFGFVTDNPTSGDAIVKSEFRLTRRATRRIGTFGQGWKEVGLLSQLQMGQDPDTDFMRNLRCRYANPSLPTPSATSDELQKMIAAKILVPDSAVTYELYGRLDDRQIEQLEKDKTAYEAKMLRQAMQEQAMASAQAAAAGGGGVGGGGNPSSQKKPPADKGAP